MKSIFMSKKLCSHGPLTSVFFFFVKRKDTRGHFGFENVHVLNFVHGRFFEKMFTGKKKVTGEIFENVHGRFSRVTQYFWICSRAGKKFHVQLFTEMRTRQSEASTSSLSNVKN